MASLLDEMMTDSSDNYLSDDDDFDSSDSEDISVAIKPQGGGVNSIKDVAKRHVLPFLPAKSAMKFRAVSKEWNQWIASPLFAYNQSFTFQKLSGYFYQRLEFEGDLTFLSLHPSANGVPSPDLGFLPDKFNIESFYHVVAAVPLLDYPVVCFEIYDLNQIHGAVLRVPIIQSEQHGGALTEIEDEVCYLTAYNDSGNVFVIDIYGGVDMSLKHSVSVTLGSKKPSTLVSKSWWIPPKEEPFTCEVLPCTDSDTVVIHTNDMIYFYHLREQKVDTL
ncbi:hypothetical protein K7X08_018421 [Anisodus acutangulus]|uniref:F-box protein n=1 Tax=Anisodus acutangulus TaxID=402998 RepID=A0A9Q1M0D1_9SOLA|nr:hypothetical protein K7X08_018421 [Anisodus acutangulus]